MTDPLRCPCCDREVFQPGEDGLYEEGIEVVCKCGAKCRVVVDGARDAEGEDADGVAYVEVDAPDPAWTSADGTLMLYRGDCVDIMRMMPEASVDAIVCDPPYDLTGLSRGGSALRGSGPFGRFRIGEHPEYCLARTMRISDISNANELQANCGDDPVLLSVMVSGFGSGVGLTVVKFGHEVGSGEVEIDDADSDRRVDDMLVDERHVRTAQQVSKVKLRLRVRKGFSGCVGPCCCTSYGRDSLPRVAVRLRYNPSAQAERSSDVVAPSCAEVRAVLSFDMTRRTAYLRPADGTDDVDPFELVATEPIRARPATGRLTSEREPDGICSVGLAANGASSFDLVAHPALTSLSPRVAQGGFMSMPWDGTGVAFRLDVWREALRVAKPGAYLCAFGGSRTFHRLACAIEDAGWEIRDDILSMQPMDVRLQALWETLDDGQRQLLVEALDDLLGRPSLLAYAQGQGFPKSVDVSKVIDKALGAKREVVGTKRGMRGADGTGHEGRMPGKAVGIQQVECEVPVTVPATDEAKRFAGWGTALRPCFEPIILARKPPQGTVAANVLKYGTGGINIDGCRIPRGDKSQSVWPARDGAVDTGLHGKQRGGADDGNPDGGWPGNVLLTHSPDCKLVGTRKIKACGVGASVQASEGYKGQSLGKDSRKQGFVCRNYADADGMETVEVWECVPDCPIRLMDLQSGMTATKRIEKPSDCGGNTWGGTFQIHRGARGHTDSGGASRFFSQLNYEADEIPCRFKYTSKASRSERDDGCDEIEPVTGATAAGRKDGAAGAKHPRAGITSKVVRNIHPTTKPLAIMDWLVKLVTPPGPNAVVLDPFVGSGTTMVACATRGVRCIGIDLDPSYAQIAVARVRRAREKAGTLAASEAKSGQQVGLFSAASPSTDDADEDV